jgi:hypothetical protein
MRTASSDFELTSGSNFNVGGIGSYTINDTTGGPKYANFHKSVSFKTSRFVLRNFLDNTIA